MRFWYHWKYEGLRLYKMEIMIIVVSYYTQTKKKVIKLFNV